MEAIIVGGSGLLGGYVKAKLADAAAPSSRELDITEESSILWALEKYRPRWLINCAAATDVDRCEREPAYAYGLNAVAVKTLSDVCRKTGVRLLHVSTDYVFDGRSSAPLKETDPTGPINVYGRSKREGEEHALAAGGTVLRVQWLYGDKKCGFIRLCREGKPFSAVTDCTGSPTYAKDAADMALHLMRTGQRGLFHGANSGSVSWYELARYLGAEPTPVKQEKLGRPARRPLYTVLDTEKLQKTCQVRPWQEAMTEFLSDMR